MMKTVWGSNVNKQSSEYKRVTISTYHEMDFEFRRLASQKFKFKKGWYSSAMAEAMALWIAYNKNTIFDKGLNNIARSGGQNIWRKFKAEQIPKIYDESDFYPLDCICKNFVTKSTFIENIDYEYDDSNFVINVDTPVLDENHNHFMMEDLVDKCTVPITITLRAGLEDITGENYRINNLTLGKSSQIHLKKINNPETNKNSEKALIEI